MKYAMTIIQTDEASERLSAAEREFTTLARWWADLRAQGKIVASARLAPPRKATTVSWHDQVPVVTDGPYVETKEAVAGFVVLEVDSAAEAIEIAGSWPNTIGTRIELRPVIEP
jgi:hypothetical protein